MELDKNRDGKFLTAYENKCAVVADKLARPLIPEKMEVTNTTNVMQDHTLPIAMCLITATSIPAEEIKVCRVEVDPLLAKKQQS